MNWIGLRDRQTRHFDPRGLDLALPALSVVPGGFASRGTVLLEVSLPAGDAPITFLDYAATTTWRSGLRIGSDGIGGLVVEQRQDDRRRTFRLATSLTGEAAHLTLSFSWDGPGQQAVLNVEIAETGKHHFATLPAPLPLSFQDIANIALNRQRAMIAPEVTYCAIADDIMPIGPLPSLAGDTMILTETGSRPIRDVRAGERILMADGDHSQVRWCGALTLPNRGHFAPLNLRAPFFGALRDLHCAPSQRIQIRSCEVEYLFATETIAALVGDLSDGTVPRRDMTTDLVTYWQLVLDRSSAMRIGGLDVEALDASRLALVPGLLAHSALAGLPAELLPQTSGAPPVLRGFETQTLCQLRAA